jgi:hypothetical protein
VGTAVDATPDLDSAAKAIGPGTAWTGSKANEVHDNLLAPSAKEFRTALHALAQDVKTVIAGTPKTVSASAAHMMELAHAHRI